MSKAIKFFDELPGLETNPEVPEKNETTVEVESADTTTDCCDCGDCSCDCGTY